MAPAAEVKRCLVDTGIVYAAADSDDAWNERARSWLGRFEAERMNIPIIATTDRRHFSAIKPRHVRAFTLLP